MVSSGRPTIWRSIAALLLLALLVAGAGAYMIDGSAFSNVTVHAINNPGGTALSYCPMRFVVSNATGVTNGDTIYTNGTTQVDWRDLRFTSTLNAVYPHHIERTNATCAFVWVNITAIPAAGTTMRIYWNSDTATQTSNGTATYRFYEGFDRADSTTIGNGWTESVGLYSINANRLEAVGNGASNSNGLNRDLTFTNGAVATFSAAAPATGATEYVQWNVLGPNGYKATIAFNNNKIVYRSGSTLTHLAAAYTPGTYYRLGIRYDSASTYSVRVDDGAWVTGIAYGTTLTGYNDLVHVSYATTATDYTDWISVRTSAATEPTHGGYGPMVAPVAAFSATPLTGGTPRVVQFTDISTDGPNAWTWVWGDGTPNGTTQNPTHTYTAAGNYTVALIAANAAGSDDEVKTDYIVLNATTVGITVPADATTHMVYVPVSASVTGFTPTSYTWSWGDGTANSTGSAPTHRYVLPAGTGSAARTITLTATDGATTVSATRAITVREMTPNALTDSFADASLWTFTRVTGTATSAMSTPVAGEVQLRAAASSTTPVVRLHLNNTNLVYNRSDAVVFTFNMSSSIPTNNAYVAAAYSYAYFDIGDTPVPVKSLYAASTPWTWYRVEYDGNGHARVNNGTWVTVNVTGPWSPRFDIYNQDSGLYGIVYSSEPNLYVKFSDFTAVRSTPAFAVDTDHGAAAPLSVTATSTAFNATSWAWTFGDGATSTDADPGSHVYSARGLFRMRLQTTSDTYGMDTDSSRAIAVGDYGFDARPYAAQYGNVSVTAKVDGRPASAYRLNWIFDGQDGYSVNTSSSLSATGRFGGTGTRNITLHITNTSTGARYEVTRPVGVRRVDVPNAVRDTLATADDWTLTQIEGTAGRAFIFGNTPGEIDVRLVANAANPVIRAHLNNTDLVYNRSDAVTFRFNSSATIPGSGHAGYSYYSYLYFDVGDTPIPIRTIRDISTPWVWHRVEYDGNGHARVDNGTWVTVNVTGPWSPRFDISHIDMAAAGGVASSEIALNVKFSDFTAVRSTPAFAVDTDHGAAAPLSVTATSTAFNATSWAWTFGDGATSTDADPGSHVYSARGLFRMRLQTTSDTYGMDTDSSRAIAVGDYGFDARPYAAQYANFSVTAKVDGRSVGAYRLNWIFDGQDGYSVNTSSSLSAAGRFGWTGTRNVTLHITNSTTGARYEVTRPVGVKRIDAPRSLSDTFQSADAWTFTSVTGTAGVGKNAVTVPSPGTVRLNAYVYGTTTYRTSQIHFNATNLVYNATDPVVFTVNMSSSIVNNAWTCAYTSRVYLDIGDTSVMVKNLSTSDTSWAWYTVEYDGNGHARVNNGAWVNVTVPGPWSPRFNVYHYNQAQGGGTVSYEMSAFVNIDTFTAIQTGQVVAATPTKGMMPFSSAFTATGYNLTTWAWDFDDGETSSAEAPTHIYERAGLYSPSVTAYSDTYGMDLGSVVMTDEIDVGYPPIPDFTATPRIGPPGLAVQFADQSINATSWNWSFGDGTFSTDRNPLHAYAATGSYTVALTAISDYGSVTSTAANYIDIGNAPIADFDVNVTAGVAPLNVSFTVVYVGGGNATAWYWDIDNDGDVEYTTRNCTHTYTENGNYSVNYTATNAYGASSMIKNDLIAVGDPPVTDFAASPRLGAAPLEVQFTDASTGNATNWSWSFGDSDASFVRNASHTYATTGLYDVGLTAANLYGSYTLTRTNYIDVGDAPAANFTANRTVVAVPGAVQFTDASVNTTAWSWSFGDGGTSAQQHPAHTYAAAGLYTVSLNASNAYGSAWLNRTAYIDAGYVPTADFAADATVVPLGQAVAFTDASTNATSWNWSFGDGAIAATRNASHAYAANGSYTVALTATNAYGSAIATKTGYIAAWHAPVADFAANATGGVAPLTVEIAPTLLDYTVQNGWYWAENESVFQYTYGGPDDPYYCTVVFDNPGVYDVGMKAVNPATSVWVNKTDYVTVVGGVTADFGANATAGTPPMTVQFTSGATNATAWNWSFGDGIYSALENPIHTYALEGLYTVSLNASNAYDSAIETKTNYVQAGEPPVAGFVANRTLGAVPFAVRFTDQSTNATSYAWDIDDDGETDYTTANVTHTYREPGTYTVNQTVANLFGPDSLVRTGHVTVGWGVDAADFAADDTAAALGQLVAFTDLSANATSWNWSFGDGSHSALQNPTHAYAAVGLYTVTLDVANAYDAATATKAGYVDVGISPSAAFAANDTIGAPGHGVAFTDTSTGTPTAWTWDFGDGSAVSHAQHPAHVYAAVGRYTVALNATNAYGSAVATETDYVDIGIPPVAAFGGLPRVGARPFAVAFVDASTENPTAWSWNFGDGSAASALQNPTHEYAVAGNFTVALTASNIYGADTETRAAYITVGTAPTAAFSASTTGAQVGTAIAFTDASTGSLPMTAWTWDFGDGSAVSHFQNPTHAYAAEGQYTVSLSVANAYGVDAETRAGYIYIGSGANASFTALPLSGPSPLTVQFTDTSQGATAWAWDFDGDGVADSTEQHPSYTFAADGFYDVTLTASNQFGGTTATKPGYVMAGPLTALNMRAAFSMDVKTGPEPLTVQFTDDSKVAADSGEYARVWDFGDGSAPSAEANPVHVYAEDGKYDVELTITSQVETDTARQEKAVYVYPDQAVAPHATTTFSVYATQMKDTEFDPIQIAELLPSAYTDQMPATLFWGLIFALIFFMIWIRNGNVVLVGILGILFVGCLLAFLDLPPEFMLIGQAFMAIATAAIFFTAILGKRR